jgi:hypothetical protein
MVLFAALLSAAPFHAALAQNAPDLGSAADFAVLGGPAVTLTSSAVIGDVGVDIGGAVTLTTTTIVGTVHKGDMVAQQAYDDFLAAYTALASESCDQTLTGTLSGMTLPPGVYCFGAAATLTGQLTLKGSSTDIWIFKIGTGGTGALTGTNFSVVMEGGGLPCNVYWWVAQAATLNYSNFKGNILAGAATTFTGGSLIGRALAKAEVTMTGLTDVFGCSSLVPPPIDEDHCKDYCKHYCKDYWKDHDKYHCKDHEKDYCKDHYCTDHNKDRCKYHDKDHRDRR